MLQDIWNRHLQISKLNKINDNFAQLFISLKKINFL